MATEHDRTQDAATQSRVLHLPVGWSPHTSSPWHPSASSLWAPALLSCTCEAGKDGDSRAKRHRACTQHPDPWGKQGAADTGTVPKHRGPREEQQVVKCKKYFVVVKCKTLFPVSPIYFSFIPFGVSRCICREISGEEEHGVLTLHRRLISDLFVCTLNAKGHPSSLSFPTSNQDLRAAQPEPHVYVLGWWWGMTTPSTCLWMDGWEKLVPMFRASVDIKHVQLCAGCGFPDVTW